MKHYNPLTEQPRDNSNKEWLRFLVQSSRPDDPELSLLVFLWGYELKNGGLTEEQEVTLTPYIVDGKAWINEVNARNDERAKAAIIAAAENVLNIPNMNSKKEEVWHEGA